MLQAQKLFLLSKDEAGAIPGNVRNIQKEWWLRSPGAGTNGTTGAIVSEFGAVTDSLVSVTRSCLVRPALRLDLSSVTFTSESNTFTVGSVDVSGMTLNPSAAQTIEVGDSVSFTASIEPADATDKKVKWSVGGTNAGAVKLYSDPNCTAGTEVGTGATSTRTVYAKGVSAGTATVTCTSNADSTKTQSCEVTVNGPYTVTVAEGIQNGTVTANPTEGQSGTPVTLTAAPSQAGYALEDISAVKTPETVAGILEAIGTASFTNDMYGTITVEGNALVWDSHDILAGSAALTQTAAGYRATGTQFHCDFAVDSDSRIRDIALTSATDETSITVHFTGVSQNSLAVSLTPGEGGVYTFNMPRSNVAVNAAFAKPHIHGEGQDAVTFQPWGSAESLPTEPGSWYLTKDVILPDRWLVPGGGVNLCLNGKKIRVNEGRDKVIAVSAGTTLDLYDCGGNGQIIGGPGITGVSVEGTFNMHAGAITGCSWGVHNSGVFAMGGGSITGNSIGVYNQKDSGQPFSFTLSGAPNISGNEVTKGEKTYTTNVYLSENCVATIAGALEETAAIGITMEKPGVFTASADSVRASDYIARFTSDDSGYTVASNGDQLSLIQTPIEYLAWDEAQQKLVRQTGDKACRAYTVVTEEITGLGMATEETWYVVSENVSSKAASPLTAR